VIKSRLVGGKVTGGSLKKNNKCTALLEKKTEGKLRLQKPSYKWEENVEL
jgi:hypothetical protein